jgi:hypothetical protein
MAAGAGDGDQRWLVECLTATLDTARDVRAFAEESLRQASLLPGSPPLPPLPSPCVSGRLIIGLKMNFVSSCFGHLLLLNCVRLMGAGCVVDATIAPKILLAD